MKATEIENKEGERNLEEEREREKREEVVVIMI